MATKLQKIAIRLQRQLYFQLVPQPFRWKSDWSGLEYTTSLLKWFPWTVGQFAVSLYLSALLFIVGTHIWISPRLHFNSVMVAVYLIMSLSIWCMLAVNSVILHGGHSFTQGYNQMLNFERNFIRLQNSHTTNFKPSKAHIHQQKLLDMLAVVVVILCGIGAWTLPAFCILTDFDAYYYLFQYVLPDIHYQTVFHIAIHMIIRFCLLLHLALEAGRLLSFMVIIAIFYLRSITNVLEVFTQSSDSIISKKCFTKLYTQFYLIFNVVQNRLNTLIYIVLTTAFWVTVLALWVTTKGYGLVDNMVYILLALASVILIGYVAVLFHLLTGICTTASDLLEKRVKDKSFGIVYKRTKQSKWELRETKNLKRVKIKYGRFFEIDSSAFSTYFISLTETLVNAVLLF